MRLGLESPILLGEVGVLKVGAGFGKDGAKHIVVVRGIVMGQDELADSRFLGHFGGFEPSRVAPAGLGLVFLGGELRVVDKNVGVLGVLAEDAIELGVPMFVIAGVDDDGSIGFEAEAGGALGMVEREGVDGEVLVVEGRLFELDKFPLGGKELKFDGEIGERHLALEDVAHLLRGPAGVEHNTIGGAVERGEEGDALDVIPVEMAH